MSEVDPARLFGRDAAAYEGGRPGYPSELFDLLCDRCGLAPGAATVEIGAGAGQATSVLLERGACPLTVVEPDPAFAELLRSRFGGEVTVCNDRFEDAALADGGFALAVSATAWHWVDQQVGLPRLASVLSPGGCAALFWNMFHDPSRPDPLSDALDQILGSLPRVGPRTGGTVSGFARDEKARVSALTQAGFGAVEKHEYHWSIPLTPLSARTLHTTFSRVLALESSERERVLDQISDLVATRFDGIVERTIHTVLYTAQRPG